MRRHPHLFEINARIFLRRLSERYGKNLTLSTIPTEEWKKIKSFGFDMIWLMGVWRRSPGARQKALQENALKKAYAEALPDWTEKDVIGSPYAVYDYSLDPALGEPEELSKTKLILNKIGLGLMVDFVPNHLAFDHPWTLSQPGYFVQPGAEEIKEHPDWFFQTSNGLYLAHGRDPNFPPWSDTVQINFFSQELRMAWVNQLIEIAKVSDGIRCDMAMLGINRIFEGIWGTFVKDHMINLEEFWLRAIREVRGIHPDFIFMAEAYWDLEWELQEMGFNFTYDKSYYDRLRHFDAHQVREHLKAAPAYQDRSVRFLENHDELRTAAVFGRDKSLAALVAAGTVPGLRLFHDGQAEGRRAFLPIQLKREPAEKTDEFIFNFYTRFFSIIDHPVFHDGEWKLLEVRPVLEGNKSHGNLLAWLWQLEKEQRVVVVNYSPFSSQGRVCFSIAAAGPKSFFLDELSGMRYPCVTEEIRASGLPVDLHMWGIHIFKI